MASSRERTASSGATILKAFLLTLPVTFVVEIVHSKSRIAIAASWVAGALLQAAVPPARRGLFAVLALAVVLGAIYVLLWP